MTAETPILNIVGEKVALGPVDSANAELYRRWVNDFETTRTLGRASKPVSRREQNDWIEKVTKPSETDVVFAIHERTGTAWRPIGCAGLNGIELIHGNASLGILIGEADARGRGLGTESVRLLLDYGFTVLGLHNIQLTVHASNPGGIRCYEKAGFKLIGRRRGSRRLGNERHDEIYMDVIASEFGGGVVAKVFRPTPSR